MTGPFTLTSGIDFHLAKDAVILISDDRATYPVDKKRYVDSITARDAHDLKISGEGVIGGQGAAWWPYSSNTSNSTRAVMLSLNSCNDTLLQNITLSNSPMFHIAIGGSAKNSTVSGVTVFASGSSPNTDACDVSGTNVLVQNCNIAASTFNVSNNLTLFPSTVLNFTLGTNATQLAVAGNLTYGGTNNIFAGPDFTNGIYQGRGTLPTLGVSPTNYNCTLFFGAATPNLMLNVALLAPTNLVATSTNLQINLKWNAVTGATSYNLKRGTVNGTYPKIFSGLTATNYSDANVTNGVNYFYVVSALGAGGESSNSISASAVPLPSNVPTNIFSQVVGNQLQLSWPQDHLGWRLQIQTNNLNTGLSTNWATVFNSTNVTSTNFPIVPTNGSVFLQLVYP